MGTMPDARPQFPPDPDPAGRRTNASALLAVLALGAVMTVWLFSPPPGSIPCGGGRLDQRSRCWAERIETALHSGGLNAAFAILAELYATEPLLASDCHAFAHRLGEFAYAKFARGEDFAVTPASAFCAYGFYHGFMETLLHATGNTAQARAFCDYADRQLAPAAADAGGACYHGIGHGAADGYDPRTWGSPEAVASPALELCETVSDTETRLFRCATGVFNALEILMSQGRAGLTLDRNDPFSFCRSQPERYAEACYTQLVVAAMNVAGNDFNAAAGFIDTIAEDGYAAPAMAALAVERVRLGKTDFADTLAYCRGLAARFRLPCVTGFAEGFLKYGPPQSEYVGALDFCSAPRLAEQDRRACFGRILSILRIWYDPEKARAICRSVEPAYQWRDCRYQ